MANIVGDSRAYGMPGANPDAHLDAWERKILKRQAENHAREWWEHFGQFIPKHILPKTKVND